MASAPPPPPPPPHGQHDQNGSHRSHGGLPDGNYDIFIIPPHSAGGGFLYLPSMQPHRNSFLLGVACTLLVGAVWTLAVPVLKVWLTQIMASGGAGVLLLVIGVGVAAWAWGKTQGESGRRPGPGGGSTPSGDQQQQHRQQQYSAGAPPNGYASPPPPQGAGTQSQDYGPPPPPPQGAGTQSHDYAPPPPREPEPPPSPEPKPPPKSASETASAWEKAREETRKREEERKRADDLRKKREEVQRAREEAEKAAKAKAEKEKWEQARTREKEQREREARERITRERLAREKEAKEREAKEAKEAREKDTREREARERADRWKAERDKERAAKEQQATAAPPPPPPSIPKAPPSAKSKYEPAPSTYTGSETGHSFRPYDTPKRAPYKNSSASSVSGVSESSYAPSQSTARTTPPPSHRGPYTTTDPDKILLKAVYLFSDSFPNKPLAQLIANEGSVTDGLILRIKSEGLFIDDDVRGVPQREWDIKAWTLKQTEEGSYSTTTVEGGPLRILRVTTRDAENKKYTFVIGDEEASKVASGLQRLKKGPQVRALKDQTIKEAEVKTVLGSLGWL